MKLRTCNLTKNINFDSYSNSGYIFYTNTVDIVREIHEVFHSVIKFPLVVSSPQSTPPTATTGSWSMMRAAHSLARPTCLSIFVFASVRARTRRNYGIATAERVATIATMIISSTKVNSEISLFLVSW